MLGSTPPAPSCHCNPVLGSQSLSHSSRNSMLTEESLSDLGAKQRDPAGVTVVTD